METGIMAKAATVVVVRETKTPSPKQEDWQQKVSCWMDKAQSPLKLASPPFEVEDYYSSDSSSASLKQVFQLEAETESSNTIVMPVMTIGTNNLKEETAAMEQLIKESEENEARIKLQEEKITRLTRKLEKRPTQSLAKSSESEAEERASIQSEASDEEVHAKKGGKLKNGGSPRLMTIEQIQDMIAKCSQDTTGRRCAQDSPLHQALQQEC